MQREICDAAFAVGCTDYFSWDIRPGRFARKLMSSAKRYARFLKDSGLVKNHNQALETVAKAAGFAHWHAFHTVTQGLIGASETEGRTPTPKSSIETIKTLIPAFVFLVKTQPECALSEHELAGLSKAAAQLAQACGSPIDPMLEMIARMNGADTWDKLLARLPEQATGPLYKFNVDENGNGRFAISRACFALNEQQDELLNEFHSRPLSEQREFEDQLARVLDVQPDFLEGLLAKVEVLRYKPEFRRQQGKLLNEAIRKAEDLLPKGFKGSIPWNEPPNRFYHRLLYGAMVWHSHEGHTAKAIALARRQLRLNKSDNLGVRMWLPVLLVADGQTVAADKACEKMTLGDNRKHAGIELVNAICHFANGRLQQSAESLYLAVFKYPPMRHVLSLDWAELGQALQEPEARRTVSPDAETLVEQYVSASMRVGGLGQTFDQWLQLPAVAHAETALAKEFHANWRQPNGSLDQWDAEVKNRASLLSKAAA